MVIRPADCSFYEGIFHPQVHARAHHLAGGDDDCVCADQIHAGQSGGAGDAAGGASGDESSKGAAGGRENQGGMSDEQAEELEEEYGYDKPVLVAYFQWLGFGSGSGCRARGYLRRGARMSSAMAKVEDFERETIVVLKGSGRQVKVSWDGEDVGTAQAVFMRDGSEVSAKGWEVRIDTPQERKQRWARRMKVDVQEAPALRAPRRAL